MLEAGFAQTINFGFIKIRYSASIKFGESALNAIGAHKLIKSGEFLMWQSLSNSKSLPKFPFPAVWYKPFAAKHVLDNKRFTVNWDNEIYVEYMPISHVTELFVYDLLSS